MTVDNILPLGRAGTVWRFPWSGILIGLAIGLASIGLFWDGLNRMWGWWIDAPEYTHGLLIPPVAAFLIWQQKDRLERLPFLGSWWGAALVLMGGALLVLGQLATIYTLIQYAYLITLAGLILAITGRPAFRLLLTPLLVLLFMIPLPQFVLANLSTKLQLLSSSLGVEFIRLFGISVFVEGNVIDLGGYKLQVAEACDGLRYLFPLMTLGFLMAYFYKGASWKRWLLFLSSVPITVLMNSFRVGTIGVMVEYWGISMAEGFLHEFQGWLVFMASALLMFGEILILNRLGRETGTWQQLFGVELPARCPRDAQVQRREMPRPFIGAAALLLLFGIVSLVMPRAVEIVPPRTVLDEFPMQLGDWRGVRSSLEGVYLDALKLDDYLLADYRGVSEAPVNLYIAYYQSQRKGEAVHSPRSCLPGGGWQLRQFDQRTLNGVTIDGAPLRVNRTIIEFGDQRQLVYYWFQQRGHVITNEFAVKWYLFLDSLTRHRTDGALVRLIVPLPRIMREEVADQELTQLSAMVAQRLTRFVPD